jgi:hypothetical protein
MKNICKDPATARLKLEFYLAFVHNKGRQGLGLQGVMNKCAVLIARNSKAGWLIPAPVMMVPLSAGGVSAMLAKEGLPPMKGWKREACW